MGQVYILHIETEDYSSGYSSDLYGISTNYDSCVFNCF